jgi:REP element-mobilizing transposase RayT
MDALPYRKSLRSPLIDYKGGWFFVTVCVKAKQNRLGRIDRGVLVINGDGEAVLGAWNELKERKGIYLDASVVMPNHFHGILALPGVDGMNLGKAMGIFKADSTRRIRLSTGEGGSFWQRGYYDHRIRNDADYFRIRNYIADNPMKWSLDRENLDRSGENDDELAWFV